MKSFFTLRAWDVQLYRLCDDLSGALLLPMLVFSPWAFGTTQPWSIWCMNVAGYALGVLLLLKIFIREVKNYPAPRWDHFSSRSGSLTRRRHRATRWFQCILAGLTLAVLTFILVSALNAAARYDSAAQIFQYQHYVPWLPHSFDVDRTWFHFWMYLGLAAAFWSLVDWLPGMTSAEERGIYTGQGQGEGRSVPLMPARLRQLLWVLCINGAVLGVEAIVQRVSGSNKLLFLVVPEVHKDAESQFGPYAYRSNAAQYFDLLWPVCLGFWWTLRRMGTGKAHYWLLPCAVIMAACPIISTSRGGALVSVGILAVALVYLGVSAAVDFVKRRSSPRWGATGWLFGFAAITLFLGWYLGWAPLQSRMAEIGEGYQNREEMYVAAEPMAKDYPVFGTGPGTFATVFQLYRFSNETYWPEQLHNDWLETRITFGWVGFLLLLAALACVGLRWFAAGGIRGSRRFVVLAWLGLTGCLVFARFDFPFQIHSTLFLFLVICAILFGLSRNPSGSRH